MKISIIIPIYNVEKYLNQCLDSLLIQTYPKDKLQIILIDDGSTDNSKYICKAYCTNYPSLFEYHYKKNGGLSSARNYGLQYICGEYVMFLDSDDYVEKDLIYNLSIKSKHKKIVECGFTWVFENSTRKYLPKRYKSLKDYALNAHVVCWNKLYQVDWLRKSEILFPKGKLFEDQDFFFKVLYKLKSSNEIATVSKNGIYYRQRKKSISNSNESRIEDLFWIYDDILNYRLNDKFNQEIEYRFCRNLLGNVLLRKVIKIKNRLYKIKIIKLIFKYIKTNFPNWRQNKYLKKGGLINFYLRWMAKIYS